MSDIEDIAKIKLRLERERERLKNRLNELDSLIQIVDEKLRKISFTTAEEMLVEKEAEEVIGEAAEAVEVPTEAEAVGRRIELLKVGGEDALTADVTRKALVLRVNPMFRVQSSSRPVNYVLKTLDSYIEEDLKRIQMGDLGLDEKLTYTMEDEEGLLRELKIVNYGSEDRSRDIMGKARWAVKTLIKEAEKEGPQNP
jgi:hypothetical protein